MAVQSVTTTKTIQVDYYAVVRDVRGVSEEKIETTAGTPLELYAELQAAHRFPWTVDTLRVAVNDDFCAWTSEIQHGDRVVFIAPVAGG